jgi:hypothetical protein
MTPSIELSLDTMPASSQLIFRNDIFAISVRTLEKIDLNVKVISLMSLFH